MQNIFLYFMTSTKIIIFRSRTGPLWLTFIIMRLLDRRKNENSPLGWKTDAYFRENWKPFYGGHVIGHEMLSLKLSKDVSKRSMAENKGKGTPKDYAAKWLGYVSSLLIYRGRGQNERGRELGDKGTGSGRAGYGKWEVLSSDPPVNPHRPPLPLPTDLLLSRIVVSL